MKFYIKPVLLSGTNPLIPDDPDNNDVELGGNGSDFGDDDFEVNTGDDNGFGNDDFDNP